MKLTTISMTLALALGATTALADTPPAKAPAPDMKKAPDAKKDAPKDVKKDAPAAKKEAPKPPTELADMAKGMAGTWKCTGKQADMADMTKMVDIKGSMSMKLDLDKWYVRGDWTGTATGMPGTFKGTMYTTFDGKKWMRVMVDNMGGMETSTSTGGKDKMVWEGESHMMGMAMKTKTTEEITAKEVKISTEGSMDGKKFAPVFEMSCKK
jgi:hypothetical protein